MIKQFSLRVSGILPRTVVLKRVSTGSSGGLVKTQMTGPSPPGGSDLVDVG